MTEQTKTNRELDEECYALLLEVYDLRKKLRRLEPKLNAACLAYGKRRGMSLFRDFHVYNDMERMGLLEKEVA